METTPFAEAPTPRARRASLRGVYLRRLRRLLRLRRQHDQDLNSQGLLLLDRSIFAAYCGCRDVGVEQKARDILHETTFVVDSPAHSLSASGGGCGPGPAARPEG